MLQLNFSPFPILESERLRFRKLTDEDAPEILVLRGNPETMKFIPRPLVVDTVGALAHIKMINDKIDENIDIKEINKASINQEFNLSHPKVKTLQEDSLKYKDMAKLEEAKKYSNVTLSVEYMQNQEQDYANVSVGIPLPLYKTENINALKAKLNSNETNDKLDSFLHNLSLQSDIYLNNLNQSARNYKLIQKEIIPLSKKIQENIENYNSFDMVKPQESIDNLNELITYETKALDEALKYYESYSQLIYFTNRGLK